MAKLFGLTNRFCLQCQSKTTWQYDPTIKHSRCKKCGADSRFAYKNRANAKKELKKIDACQETTIQDDYTNSYIKYCFKYLAFAERNYWSWIH
jgi:hypothetical protein